MQMLVRDRGDPGSPNANDVNGTTALNNNNASDHIHKQNHKEQSIGGG